MWLKLVPDSVDKNDIFGYSVSISASQAIVGSYGDDDKGSNSGSVYSFDLSGGNATKLVAFDGAKNDKFGFSVGASGTKLVIGAYGDDDNGSNSGSAYVIG